MTDAQLQDAQSLRGFCPCGAIALGHPHVAWRNYHPLPKVLKGRIGCPPQGAWFGLEGWRIDFGGRRHRPQRPSIPRSSGKFGRPRTIASCSAVTNLIPFKSVAASERQGRRMISGISHGACSVELGCGAQ